MYHKGRSNPIPRVPAAPSRRGDRGEGPTKGTERRAMLGINRRHASDIGPQTPRPPRVRRCTNNRMATVPSQAHAFHGHHGLTGPAHGLGKGLNSRTGCWAWGMAWANEGRACKTRGPSNSPYATHPRPRCTWCRARPRQLAMRSPTAPFSAQLGISRGLVPEARGCW